MLMLRRRMLRRKTDEARTQTYTLREPEQSKCISTCHKSRTIRKFRRRPEWGAPRSGTCLYTYRKNPSVWTNCLGNQKTDCNCLPACHFWTSGLVAGPGTRAPGHNPDPRAHGHTGTTPIHGHTGTRAKPTREPTSHGCVPHTTPRNISAKKIWFIMVSPGPGCMHVCIYIYVCTYVENERVCHIPSLG